MVQRVSGRNLIYCWDVILAATIDFSGRHRNGFRFAKSLESDPAAKKVAPSYQFTCFRYMDSTHFLSLYRFVNSVLESI